MKGRKKERKKERSKAYLQAKRKFLSIKKCWNVSVSLTLKTLKKCIALTREKCNFPSDCGTKYFSYALNWFKSKVNGWNIYSQKNISIEK